MESYPIPLWHAHTAKKTTIKVKTNDDEYEYTNLHAVPIKIKASEYLASLNLNM